MSNDTTTSLPVTDVPGPDLFLEAAWTHAREFMREKGYVPDVMILGRYADEELMFVFPSGQEREQFAKTCIAEAAAFGATIAMMAREAEFKNIPVIAVHWKERGQPTRLQVAAIERRLGQDAKIGPINALAGEHSNDFLDVVFGEAKH